MSESSAKDFTRRKFITKAGQGLAAAIVVGEIIQSVSAQQPKPSNNNQRQGGASMLRHVILFKLKPNVSVADRDRWLELGRQLPSKIKVIRGFSIGTDILHQKRSYDVAIIADFASLDDYHAYEAHPAHADFHKGSVNLSEQIISVDFQL